MKNFKFLKNFIFSIFSLCAILCVNTNVDAMGNPAEQGNHHEHRGLKRSATWELPANPLSPSYFPSVNSSDNDNLYLPTTSGNNDLEPIYPAVSSGSNSFDLFQPTTSGTGNNLEATLSENNSMLPTLNSTTTATTTAATATTTNANPNLISAPVTQNFDNPDNDNNDDAEIEQQKDEGQKAIKSAQKIIHRNKSAKAISNEAQKLLTKAQYIFLDILNKIKNLKRCHEKRNIQTAYRSLGWILELKSGNFAPDNIQADQLDAWLKEKEEAGKKARANGKYTDAKNIFLSILRNTHGHNFNNLRTRIHGALGRITAILLNNPNLNNSSTSSTSSNSNTNNTNNSTTSTTMDIDSTTTNDSDTQSTAAETTTNNSNSPAPLNNNPLNQLSASTLYDDLFLPITSNINPDPVVSSDNNSLNFLPISSSNNGNFEATLPSSSQTLNLTKTTANASTADTINLGAIDELDFALTDNDNEVIQAVLDDANNGITLQPKASTSMNANDYEDEIALQSRTTPQQDQFYAEIKQQKDDGQKAIKSAQKIIHRNKSAKEISNEAQKLLTKAQYIFLDVLNKIKNHKHCHEKRNIPTAAYRSLGWILELKSGNVAPDSIQANQLDAWLKEKEEAGKKATANGKYTDAKNIFLSILRNTRGHNFKHLITRIHGALGKIAEILSNNPNLNINNNTSISSSSSTTTNTDNNPTNTAVNIPSTPTNNALTHYIELGETFEQQNNINNAYTPKDIPESQLQEKLKKARLLILSLKQETNKKTFKEPIEILLGILKKSNTIQYEFINQIAKFYLGQIAEILANNHNLNTNSTSSTSSSNPSSSTTTNTSNSNAFETSQNYDTPSEH